MSLLLKSNQAVTCSANKASCHLESNFSNKRLGMIPNQTRKHGVFLMSRNIVFCIREQTAATNLPYLKWQLPNVAGWIAF